MQYTSSTNIDPLKATLGERSPGVLALQKKINMENAGKAGYVPLKEDSLYGPLTQAASQPSKLITTSSPIRSKIIRDTTELNNALSLFNLPSGQSTNPNAVDGEKKKVEAPDPYLSILDNMASRSDAGTKALISTIQATKMRKSNAINKQYEDYKGGLQLLGIQGNDAQSSPELLAGHIQEAETQHLEKLSELDAEEAKALLDAQQAKDNNDYKTLSAKISYMKELKSEKAAALKEYYDSITKTPKIAEEVSHSIYETLLTLSDEDKESFLLAVAKQYSLPLGTLVTALTDEQGKRQADELKTRNTESIIRKRESGGGGKTPTGKISTAQITAGQQYLDSKRGKDGFTDPYEYISAFKEFTEEKGGTVKQWITNFPVSGKGGYINPTFLSNPDFPAVLKPKTTSGSSRSQ